MKLALTPANVYATVAGNGSVSCPPAFFGRAASVVEKEVGKLNAPVVVPRVRTAEPLQSIPLDAQPTWARCHSWIARRGEPVVVATVAALVKAGKVQLVKGELKGKVETFVLPASWKTGQKLPKVTGVLPSDTFNKGRVESYAVQSEGAIVANADRRAKGVVLGGGKKTAPPVKPAKATAKPAAPKTPAAAKK